MNDHNRSTAKSASARNNQQPRKTMTLLGTLTGPLPCDQSLAVYAKKIGEKFTPDSPARFGAISFNDDRTTDGCELFEWNDLIVDSLGEWISEVEAIQLINRINEAIYLSGHNRSTDCEECKCAQSRIEELERRLNGVAAENKRLREKNRELRAAMPRD